ncbi:MAG: HNH endonuclease [Pirellulales bacterium]
MWPFFRLGRGHCCALRNAWIGQLVRDRAERRCEYCGLPQEWTPLAPLQIEHIIPRKHGGSDDLYNLALACIDCNLHKGSNIAGLDPESGMMLQLYNPRGHKWSDHFERKGPLIVGKTPIGRTTVRVLGLNSDDQIELRELAGNS